MPVKEFINQRTCCKNKKETNYYEEANWSKLITREKCKQKAWMNTYPQGCFIESKQIYREVKKSKHKN